MTKKLNYEADSEFFATYLKNEELILTYTAKLTYSTKCVYPVHTKEGFEDIVGHVRDELARTGAFLNFDEKRGTFSSYLFARIRLITGTHFRAIQRHSEVLVENDRVSGESLQLGTEKLVYGETFNEVMTNSTNHEGTLDRELMEQLETVLNGKELRLVKAIAEEDLRGQDLYRHLDMNAMALSRLRLSVKSKIRRTMHNFGFVLAS